MPGNPLEIQESPETPSRGRGAQGKRGQGRHRPDPHGHRALRHHARPVVRQGQEGHDEPDRCEEGDGAQIGREGQARSDQVPRRRQHMDRPRQQAAVAGRSARRRQATRGLRRQLSLSVPLAGHPVDDGLFRRGAAVPLHQPSRLKLAASGWAPAKVIAGRSGHAQRGRSMSSHSPSACSIGKCPRARHSASRCSARRKSLRPRSRNGRIAR